MKRKALSIFVFSLLVLPSITLADGLVPCGGIDSTGAPEPVCNTCYFIGLLNNVLAWLVGILSIIFSIMIVVSGLRMVTSAGNVQAKSDAKKRIMNGLIGFVIVLSAWLLIDFMMKALLAPGAGGLGPWNTVQCMNQVVPTG